MTSLRTLGKTFQFKFVIQHHKALFRQVLVQLDPGVSLDVHGLHIVFTDHDNQKDYEFPLSGGFFEEIQRCGDLRVFASKEFHGYHTFPTVAYRTDPEKHLSVPLPIFECFFPEEDHV